MESISYVNKRVVYNYEKTYSELKVTVLSDSVEMQVSTIFLQIRIIKTPYFLFVTIDISGIY